ncbi:MAG: hypothetical protein D6719_05895 [Candidatus Dadabacteria bacterium]|nr:MAG: hypothetical protein D6719_05895 [Candidatus Dadabacteria bacterium]
MAFTPDYRPSKPDAERGLKDGGLPEVSAGERAVAMCQDRLTRFEIGHWRLIKPEKGSAFFLFEDSSGFYSVRRDHKEGVESFSTTVYRPEEGNLVDRGRDSEALFKKMEYQWQVLNEVKQALESLPPEAWSLLRGDGAGGHKVIYKADFNSGSIAVQTGGLMLIDPGSIKITMKDGRELSFVSSLSDDVKNFIDRMVAYEREKQHVWKLVQHIISEQSGLLWETSIDHLPAGGINSSADDYIGYKYSLKEHPVAGFRSGTLYVYPVAEASSSEHEVKLVRPGKPGLVLKGPLASKIYSKVLKHAHAAKELLYLARYEAQSPAKWTMTRDKQSGDIILACDTDKGPLQIRVRQENDRSQAEITSGPGGGPLQYAGPIRGDEALGIAIMVLKYHTS